MGYGVECRVAWDWDGHWAFGFRLRMCGLRDLTEGELVVDCLGISAFEVYICSRTHWFGV